jgi:hypothetical protein
MWGYIVIAIIAIIIAIGLITYLMIPVNTMVATTDSGTVSYTNQFKLGGLNKCLTVANASTDDGTPLIQADCTDIDEQRFTYNPVTQELRTANSNKCVDVLNDGSLQQNSCSGGPPQKWTYSNQLLKNTNSGLCAGVAYMMSPAGILVPDPTNGTPVKLYDCALPANNVMWSVQA